MAYLGVIGTFFVVAIVATTASLANAQTPPPAAPSGPPFVLQSNGGDNLLQIDVLAHLDVRFALNDSGGAIANTFTVRRFRPILQGRLLRRFEFFFNPDFGGGTTVVQDAYFDTLFSSAFRVRIGKSKTPVGLERPILANSLL
jgi:phosphate-selective porin OprO and OprP